MSALPITEPCEERGAFFKLGQVSYQMGKAEDDARALKARALEAERLLEALTETLGVDFEILERIGQTDSTYFKEVREQILEALSNWDEDQKIPVCLSCSSPRVDWIEWGGSTGVAAPDGSAEAAQGCGWCCQDCGAIEDTTGEERRGRTSFAVNDQTKGVSL